MNTVTKLSRRDFFELAGAGIAVVVGLGLPDAHAQHHQPVYPEDINAYLLIGADGRVTVFSGKIEMGQGVMTSQAQMLAEELGVDLESIDIVLGDTDRCPWDMGTFGSLTTRMFGPALRTAGAEARAALIDLAATALAVPKERLYVHSGVVSVIDDPARQISYAELAKGRRISRVVNEKAVLRNTAAFRVMGRSAPRLDARDKVTGAAKYAADIRRPNMLYARILRPPAHGAKLLNVDASGATLAGARVIQQGDYVAVLHTDPQAAGMALGRIQAKWTLPAAESPPASELDPETIFAHLVQAAPLPTQSGERGDIRVGREQSVHVFQSTYRKGYVAHASIEPHAAIAEVTPDKATVWASTQTPFPTRDRIAKALGRDPKTVRVITPYLGGGFGGKSADQQAVEAAQLAQLCGKPVQVAWDRAEEFYFDRFDPAAVVTAESGMNAQGRVVLWDFLTYAAGERGSAHVYDIANMRIRSAGAPLYGTSSVGPEHPFAVGPWRAPGANMNVFAIESQMDVMASSARIDPLEFRLRHLSDGRMRRVLAAAAAAFGWSDRTRSPDHGFGVACSTDAGSFVATMAEIAVDRPSGRIQVIRVTCALDLGTVVNPDGARMQIEGAVTMGLGYSLSEELNFRAGKILNHNFDSYALPRFSALPRIQAILVPDDGLPPQGAGEPPITTMGAVLANALFNATGARMFRLPMTPQRVLAALRQVAD